MYTTHNVIRITYKIGYIPYQRLKRYNICYDSENLFILYEFYDKKGMGRQTIEAEQR